MKVDLAVFPEILLLKKQNINVIINTKIEGKKLNFNQTKCHKMHIGDKSKGNVKGALKEIATETLKEIKREL